jgi:small multidrug resistance family-3 protein
MRTFIALITAAILEVGGDALIRAGFRGRGIVLIVIGLVALFCYGVLVNLTALDFGRLMGIYIVLFFLIAQTTAVFAFREKLSPPTIIGGLLVVAGGITMVAWRNN